MVLNQAPHVDFTLNVSSKKAFLYHLLPVGSDGEEPACNVGDPSSIPGSEGSPGEGNGYPLSFSCLENSVDRGTWWATVYGVAGSQA